MLYVGKKKTIRLLDYIESTGTQYVDTGYVPNANTIVECKAQLTSTGTARDGALLGSRTGGDIKDQFIFWHNNATNASTEAIAFAYATGNTGLYNSTNFKQHVIKNNVGKLYVDGTLISEATTSLVTPAYPIYLFALNQANSADSRMFNGKVFYCKIYDNGTLIRDFKPCLDENNVACLYDTVTDTFFYNKGTGTFNYGEITGTYEKDTARKVKKMYVGKLDTIEFLDYIESTGTQYIDTDVLGKFGLKVETKASYDGIIDSSTGASLLACRNDDSVAKRCYHGYRIYNNHMNIGYGDEYESNKIPTQGQAYVTISDMTQNPITLTVDNTVILTQTATTGRDANINMYLFANNNKGSVNAPWIGKLYYCKIWDNGTLVRDFKPCIVNNSMVCMYDTISQTLFYNQGTGNFVAGNKTGENIISGKSKKVIKGYVGVSETLTPVEYIESTGTQYIDTGFVPNQDTKSELSIKFIGTTGGNQGVFCARNTYNSQTYSCILNTSQNIICDYNTTRYTTSDTLTYGDIYDIVLDKNKLYIDNSLKNTFQTGMFTSPNSIVLLNSRTSSGIDGAYAFASIYYCKIWDNGTLVRDFIPVKRANGEYCLYDKVEGKLYRNQGAGSFSGGSTTGESFITICQAKLFWKSGHPEYLNAFDGNTNHYSYSMVSNTKDYVLIGGGKSSSSSTPNGTVLAYNKNIVTTSADNLPTTAANGASANINGRAIFAGGFSGSSWASRTSQCIAYDNNLARTTCSSLDTAVYELASASNNTHGMFVSGCTYSSNSNQAISYNTNLVKTTLTNSSGYRRGGCGASTSNHLIFCGSTSSSAATDFYNNSNVKTTASNPYNKACWCPRGLNTNDYAIFFGGATGENASNAFDDIKAYDKNLTLHSANLPSNYWRMSGFNCNGEYVVVAYGGTAYIYDNNLVRKETVSIQYIGDCQSNTGGSTEDFGLIRGYWTNKGAVFSF